MVYWGWDPEVIYISFSDDGIIWEYPTAITNLSEGKARYPNLISDSGDTNGGANLRLYYSRNQNSMGVRELVGRVLTIKKLTPDEESENDYIMDI